MKEPKHAGNSDNYYAKVKNATIFHGSGISLLSKMRERPIDLVFTSPPYNLGKSYGGKTEPTLDLRAYKAEQREVITSCVSRLAPTGSLCWQVGNYVEDGAVYPLDAVLLDVFLEAGLVLRNRVIWGFDHGLHCSRRLSGRYETVLWFTFPGASYTFNLDSIRVPQKYPGKRSFRGAKAGALSGNPMGKNPGDRWSSDVWDIPNIKANHVEKTEHPCQFPVALVERFVLALTNPGDLVLDPFAGTFSSAVAAELNNRRSLSAEIVLKYCKIGANRLRGLQDGSTRVRADTPPLSPRGKLTINPWTSQPGTAIIS